MNSQFENGTLFFYPEGAINTTNAPDVRKDLFSVYDACEKEYGSFPVVLDAEKLEYISSSGLRILLELRKRCKDARIINVSPAVYDVLSMTGFTDFYRVEKQYRKVSVDGCAIIGQGAKGTVYRLDADTIVKVFKSPDCLPDIQKEREFARRAFVLGIPTAITFDIVRVGESFGTMFELLSARSYSKLFRDEPENRALYVGEFAALLRKIHTTTVSKEEFPPIKQFVRDWLNTDKPYLSAESFGKLDRLLTELPEPPILLHCDFHSNNVMRQNGEAILIDMDTLSYGHPVTELANVYITFVGFGEVDPGIVESFLGLPYDTAVQIWNSFLPAYLQTDDASRVEDVERKARLIAYLRLLRHTVRGNDRDTENGRATVALCLRKIDDMLQTIDTLAFDL